MLVAGNNASSYILWFQPMQQHTGSSPHSCCLQYCKCIHSVVSACSNTTHSSPHACCQQYSKFIHPVVSACANTSSSPHAWCRQYGKFIHSVVSACATTHRQFTTCLLPAIRQAHITHNVFSLPRTCCLQVHIIIQTTLPASW